MAGNFRSSGVALVVRACGAKKWPAGSRSPVLGPDLFRTPFLCRCPDTHHSSAIGSIGGATTYARAATGLYPPFSFQRRATGRMGSAPQALALAGAVSASLSGNVVCPAPAFSFHAPLGTPLDEE